METAAQSVKHRRESKKNKAFDMFKIEFLFILLFIFLVVYIYNTPTIPKNHIIWKRMQARNDIFVFIFSSIQ